MFQIATGILIFHGNLQCSCMEDKSFSDNFSRLLVNSYCCPKRLTAYMIDISFTCHHCLSNGEGCVFFFLSLYFFLFLFFFGREQSHICLVQFIILESMSCVFILCVYIYVFRSQNATSKMVTKKFIFLKQFWLLVEQEIASQLCNYQVPVILLYKGIWRCGKGFGVLFMTPLMQYKSMGQS